ncbi:PEP-CTERM sorting domain-containing protein [Fischerella sp. JS2]|uniref:PEP-CTERM sorting domain-containing protein n=1 Tax=Fischerella sp. JS2 TaxID=2597771 RepID=UPI0028E86B22|nr:PEP-CTERM sorting domain-containing protein [Fischerella sp. JS2]
MMIFNKLSLMTAGAILTTLGTIATSSSTHAATTFFGPSPYQSFDDSPLKGGDYSYFYLEDFEDGALNTPGVTASTGQVKGPEPLRDSVDADDGFVDGKGINGYSYYLANNNLIFNFDQNILGSLPTDAGITWTDSFPVADVVFEAFDAGKNSLGTIVASNLGDGSLDGGTTEDRFFGVFNTDGISAIKISMPNSNDWEVDHLQYGLKKSQPVPEPLTILGSLAAGAIGVGLRQKRQQKLAKKHKSIV